MSYSDTVISSLSEIAEDNMYNKCVAIDANVDDLKSISDLCFYVNELNKKNPKVCEKIQERLQKLKFSESDIKLCSNFDTYTEAYRDRLLKNPSIVRKMNEYANVLQGNLRFDNDNQINLFVTENSSSQEDPQEKKAVLDINYSTKKYTRQAWLAKAKNELGL